MTDLSSIEVGQLSLEEIEQLLPQLYQDLEKAKDAESATLATQEVDDRPLNEIVDDKFSRIWGDLEKEYNDKFDEDLKKEEDSFILDNGIKIVLESSIGKDYTKMFFKVVNRCLKERNFRVSQRFFRNVEDPEVSNVAKLSFAVYRLNLPADYDDSFVKRKRAKEYVSELSKVESPLMKTVTNDFIEVGLLPS